MAKHILLYSDDHGVGGVAQYNHAIGLGLINHGYVVTVAQTQSANPLIEEQQHHGIYHKWIEFDTVAEFGRTVTDAEAPRAIFSQVQPDLIIFSDCCPLSNMAAKQIALQLAIPYVVVIGFVAAFLAEYFQEQANPEVYLQMLAQQYDRASAVVAVSQQNLDLLRATFGLNAKQGQVIHYGRPAEYFVPPNPAVRDRLRRETGILDDGVVCFTAARLEAIKGFQYQLDAIVKLKQTPAWLKLYIIWAGEGTLKAELAEAIEREGVGNRVKLLGQRWDIADWLDAADIFVLPSEHEGMPLAIMEAMAKGLPVVATAVSGIPEELGDTGKLLPDPTLNSQATIDQLVATLQAWVENPQQRRSLGEAAKQRAAQLFTLDRMVRETIALVEAALTPDVKETPMTEAPPEAESSEESASVSATPFPINDYISPNLLQVKPDSAFPHMLVGDPTACPWAYLRRDIPHTWYVDQRHPLVGFLSRDEAHILYNNALQFKGKRALEIGCWMGWSACHLALAGVELDIVDPLLSRADFFASVRHSLKTAGVLDHVNLVPGYSPQAVEGLAVHQRRKWSLIFIDGNHDAPAPLQDAIACELLAEADAMILFHDLASPEVAQGLDYLRQRGWHTLIYQTMQVMGVAWRGAVEPIQHQPDPTVKWVLPNHLAYYSVSHISQTPGTIPSSAATPPIWTVAAATPIQTPSATTPSPVTPERSTPTALPSDALLTIQQAAQRYTYRGAPLVKNPFDLALYPMLIWAVTPRTVIEIGGDEGSSATWLGDLLHTFGMDGRVYAVRSGAITVKHSRVTFLQESQPLTNLLRADFFNALPRPLLGIIARSTYELVKQALDWFHPHLQPQEYLLIETGMGLDSGLSATDRALKEFLAVHGDEYEIDTTYCDFFGYNVTGNPNGYLKKRSVGGDRSIPPVASQSAQEDASAKPQATPTPVAQELPVITELEEVLGIISIEQLAELVGECQQNSEASLALGQLRRIRRQLAEYWLGSFADELRKAYLGSLGDAHRLLLGSNLRNQPLTVAEQALQREAIAYLGDGVSIPGGIQHLLVVMLYASPHPSLPPSLLDIPAWLLRDYLEWIIAPLGEVGTNTSMDSWATPIRQAIATADLDWRSHLKQALQQVMQQLKLDNSGDRPVITEVIQALVDQCQTQESLNSFNLSPINWIVFPDWHQSEEALFQDLVKLLRTVLNSSERDRLTLLIGTEGIDPTDADLAISGVLMHLLTEDTIDPESSPQLTILPPLNRVQWQVLRPHLTLHLQLPQSSPPSVESDESLPIWQIT